MKKSIIYIVLTIITVNCYAQLPGLKKLKIETVDSLYIKGVGAYPIRHVKTTQDEYHYYLLNSDDTTALRKTPRSRVERLVEAPKVNESISVLDDSALEGKELLIQISPFSPSLSRYWQVVIDDGINGNYILTDEEGNRVKLLSEMAIINYLIGRGWKLHLIQNVETGEVGGATSLLGGLFGGKVTLSKNVYFFKFLYKP